MAGVNKVILVGNLGNDPDVKFMPNGDAITKISIATSESWKDRNTGEKKEVTEWHRVVLFRGLGKVAGDYLRKGSKVYIEGKLKTNKWQAPDGSDRYSTDIIADSMQMLDARGAGQAQEGYGGGYNSAPSPAPQQQPQQPQGQPQGNPGGQPQSAPPASNFDDFEDDIPF